MRTPPVRRLLWLLAFAFVLHAAEEWNLVPGLAAHFEPAPRFSDRDARTLQLLFALLGFAFTALSLRLLSLLAALFALLPLYAAMGATLSESQLVLQELGASLARFLRGEC